MTTRIVVVLALAAALAAAPAIARAESSDPPLGLPVRAVGLGVDIVVADIGPSTGSGYGGAMFASLGSRRINLVADVAFGALDGSGDRGRLGYYLRGSIGGRILGATLLSNRDTSIDLALDAGIGTLRYLLDEGVAAQRPYVYAGWGLHAGGPRGGRHGVQFSYDLRVAAMPRIDDADAMRVICRGSCPTMDDSAVDITVLGTLGLAAW